ncbi:MAG TPA: 16S rRNA (cytosine(1402)-N(4))-methyltransferase [Holosporales bacterium]|nr:16S rRNA (cytosine(1402)-N(4))-methyltransferase [Holosporales bacterium]
MTEPRLERGNPLHYSVMLDEVLDSLNLQSNGSYLDCTFGRGGYSKGVLEALGTTKIIALDRDATAREAASEFKAQYADRFYFHPVCFDQMAEALSEDEKLDGIMFDLGVSSPQLDRPERGFSFRFKGPLDMRMGNEGITAADVVNTYGESELADLIYLYGEEKKSRVVAKAIVMDRKEKPFETTSELAGLLRRIIPKSKDGIDPATRTFQALRIHVNDELGQLERALDASLALLKPGGRLVVVSFHSLEDRIVKKFMVKHSKKEAVNRYVPEVLGASSEQPVLKLVSRKAVLPKAEEVKENPRSRSAKLRVAEYLG